MLAYEKITCSTDKCRGNAYVALDLRSYKKGRVRNDDIRDRLGVAPIEEKLVQHRLRWFGHVQRRPPEAPVRSGILSQDSNVKRQRKTEVDLGRGNKMRLERMEYTQRLNLR